VQLVPGAGRAVVNVGLLGSGTTPGVVIGAAIGVEIMVAVFIGGFAAAAAAVVGTAGVKAEAGTVPPFPPLPLVATIG
jgi:hypothetical protein